MKELDDANAVCISSMTGTQINGAIETAKIIKSYKPNIPIIWGGVHASLLPEQTLKSEYVDYIIKGEGEHALLELITDLERGTAKNKVYEQKDWEELDRLPEVDYNLIKDIKPYILNLYQSHNTLSLATDRGCPHRCTYCYNTSFNKRKWRPVSPEKLIQRIKRLKEFGAESIDLVGDNFFVSKERVEEFCELLDKEGLNMSFMSNCRIDYICRFKLDFLKVVKAHGFNEMFIGGESGSDKVLKLIQKDITRKQIITANLILKDVGINPIYSFMCGFPNETREDVYQTVDLMIKLIKDNPKASLTALKIYTPFPGTECYKECERQGMKFPTRLEDWASFDYNTAQFTKDRLLEKISYLTYFLDKKNMLNFTKNKLLQYIIRLYSITVLLRCKYKIWFMPEWKLIKWVKNL